MNNNQTSDQVADQTNDGARQPQTNENPSGAPQRQETETKEEEITEPQPAQDVNREGNSKTL